MEEAVNTPGREPLKTRRSKKPLIVVLIVLVVVAVGAYLICGITHREGTHSGILTKVEKTGVLFKTHEGEMKITGIQEGQDTIVQGRIFLFSVRDAEVYKELEPLQGQRITVRFREVLNNFFWQGKTDFFVEEVVKPEVE